MRSQETIQDKTQISEYPTTYCEMQIGKVLYCVTSVFKGEKELGPTLERLAARRVIDEMDGKARELLGA